MDWFNQHLEEVETPKEKQKFPFLSSDERAYLNELEPTKYLDVFQDRLSEIAELKGVSEKQLIEALEPAVRQQFLKEEYEFLKEKVELSPEEYLKIKDFSLGRDLKIEVKEGNIHLLNTEGRSIVSLSPQAKTGEVLIGEHYYHRPFNMYSGIERKEFRLSDYQIKDVFNIYGPNSKLVGSNKVLDKDGIHYEIPIGVKEEQYHGMAVRIYGEPDFSKYAVDTIPINSDAVVRESHSHKVEATQILAKNYIEGKYPAGTFTPEQEKELHAIVNGKKAETISGLTPHHVGNAQIQYVQTIPHSGVNHIGGSWLMNEKNYFKDIESLRPKVNERAKLTSEQVEYIREVLPLNDLPFLINCIDELSDIKPPKAIDADKEIATLIEPVKEKIDSIYLEAPENLIQINEIAEEMSKIGELDYSKWITLPLAQRMDVLQHLEKEVAFITHRPSCKLFVEDLGNDYLGYYSEETGDIVLNQNYLTSNSFNDYQVVLDTLIHEGRHAYQHYNLYEREVHPLHGDISNWELNEFEYGYQDVAFYGFKAYEMQPLETDARSFAENVLNNYNNRIS